MKLQKFDIRNDKIYGNWDPIITVYWINNIDPEFLKSKFQEMYKENLNDGGELIFDIVKSGSHLHPHNHYPVCLSESLYSKPYIVGENYDSAKDTDKMMRQVVSRNK